MLNSKSSKQPAAKRRKGGKKSSSGSSSSGQIQSISEATSSTRKRTAPEEDTIEGLKAQIANLNHENNGLKQQLSAFNRALHFEKNKNMMLAAQIETLKKICFGLEAKLEKVHDERAVLAQNHTRIVLQLISMLQMVFPTQTLPYPALLQLQPEGDPIVMTGSTPASSSIHDQPNSLQEAGSVSEWPQAATPVESDFVLPSTENARTDLSLNFFSSLPKLDTVEDYCSTSPLDSWPLPNLFD